MPLFDWIRSDLHSLNLDWIISKIKTVEESEQGAVDAAADANASKTAAAASATAANNSKTAAAGSATAAAGSAAQAQALVDQLDTTIAQDVSDWLDEHITPTTPAVDDTLTVSGAAADAKVTGDKITELKTAFDELTDVTVQTFVNESYSSALPVKRESVSIPTGNSNVAIPNDTSLVKTFEAGKKYFAYAEITIENLSGYVAGNLYLRWSYTTSQPVIQDMFAGTNAQIIQNGKIILYGFFTSVAGDSRPIIAPMNTSSAYSCDITLDKLFLFETEKDLHEECADSENVKRIYLQKLDDDVVTYDSLSAELKKQIPSTESIVVDCWGDSLTQGAGSTNFPYPTKLQELIGNDYTVNNYGQGSESAEDVAFRQGGLSAIVDPFTFNAGDTEKTVNAKFVNGASLGNLNISGLYNGDNRVYIDNNPFMFRRTISNQFYVGLQGDTSSVRSYSRPQLMVAEGEGTGHIALICIGQNGWINTDTETLADIIGGMVTHNNSSQYLVLGRPTGNTSLRSAEETTLASRYNEHFVNLREYISQYGLADNNLTATEADTEAMAIGAIPPQLISDTVHLNDYGYIAMAKCIYQRGKTLGYWD